MAIKSFTVRMDENLKNDFDSVAKKMGMNTTTALNVLAQMAVNYQGIPVPVIAGPIESAEERAELTRVLRERVAYARSKDAVRISNDDLAKELGVW